jgi:glycosyltransferase involved in cell wall biosynthesis
MPGIAVITPVYNREGIVQKTIESVIDQTFTDWEYILVDDGSTDKSWFVISTYAETDDRIRIFKRDKEPKGGSNCRNIGVEYSTSDLILFLDSDDILEPHCLEQRYNYMKNHPHVDMGVFPFIIEMETEDNTLVRRIVHPETNGTDFLRRILSFDIPWQTTAPVWRKDFFLSLGGFNPVFQRYQDVELTVRAFIGNATVEIVHGCPPDYVYYLYAKSCDFNVNYQAQLKLLEHIASIFSIKERKLTDEYLGTFLQHKYRKQATFANYKKAKRLIDEYRNYKIISLTQVILLKPLILFQFISVYISGKNRIAYKKCLLKIFRKKSFNTYTP